jgi:transcriptional regulator with XRE-family HTH domain
MNKNVINWWPEMTLSEIVKNYRNINHLSMQEFADRCGLSKGYISMLEKGQHPQNARKLVPTIETLAKIAKGMNTDIDTFISALDFDTFVKVNAEQDTDVDFFESISVLRSACDVITEQDKAIIKIIADKYK